MRKYFHSLLIYLKNNGLAKTKTVTVFFEKVYNICSKKCMIS